MTSEGSQRPKALRIAAGLFLAALGAAAFSAPASAVDGAIRGPDGVFTLAPDANWTKFETPRQIGVKCTDKACGGDRVFCLVQTRSDAEAKPGLALPDEIARKFGDGVLASAPKELTASFVEPFAPRRFGRNPGQWAEVKAEGAAGALRFGLFLTAAKGYDVAFNCVAPSQKWAEHAPKIEALLGDVNIAP